jgi:hypothetical protein
VQRLRRKSLFAGVAATGGGVFYMLEEDDLSGDTALRQMTDPLVRDP